MNNIQQNPQISFNGLLYGRIGNHLTKSILCCPHGDSKFVKFITDIGESKPNSLKINTNNTGLYKIIIETEQIPKVNIFEKLFFRISKHQAKALQMRKEGKISSLIFQLNELEFQQLKNDYPFIKDKTINKFIQIIRKSLPSDKKNFLDEFFKEK